MKRLFCVIRARILQSLAAGPLSVNQIATKTGINWKTVDRHIIYLLGKGWTQEVYFCKYVKIVQLTEKGKQLVIETAEKEKQQIEVPAV